MIVAASLLTAACDHSEQTPTEIQQRAHTSAPLRSTIGPVPAQVRDDEEALADLARAAKSSAGFYYDPQGNLVVRVRDELDGGIARATIAQLFANGKIRRNAKGLPNIIVRGADFTYGELATWRDIIFDRVFNSLPGVNSLDLDEERNRVTIGIDPSTADAVQPAVTAAIRELGIDTAAVAFRVHPLLHGESGSRMKSLNAAAFFGTVVNQPWDTLVGGIVVRSSSSVELNGEAGDCTLGFVVDHTLNGSTTRGFVVPTHCTAVWGAPDNTTMSEDTTLVGSNGLDPNKYHCGLNWCRASDAALFPVANNFPSRVGLIARTMSPNNGYHNGGSGSLTVDPNAPYFIVVDVETNGYLPVGQRVEKMGQTTGWTWGPINSTCVDHHYNPPGGFVELYTTRCAFEANIHHLDGDSGGPYLMLGGGINVAPGTGPGVTLLGTHIGATNTQNGVFSKYSRILSDMGGTFSATRGVNLATPTGVSGSINGAGNPVITWNAVPGATQYQVIKEIMVITGYNEFGYPEYGLSTQVAAIVTGTSDTDPYELVTTGGAWEDHISYAVDAISKTDVSYRSQWVTFYRQ